MFQMISSNRFSFSIENCLLVNVLSLWIFEYLQQMFSEQIYKYMTVVFICFWNLHRNLYETLSGYSMKTPHWKEPDFKQGNDIILCAWTKLQRHFREIKTKSYILYRDWMKYYLLNCIEFKRPSQNKRYSEMNFYQLTTYTLGDVRLIVLCYKKNSSPGCGNNVICCVVRFQLNG